jgi:hypothetical protein
MSDEMNKVDERLKSWTYPSAAASGHVEVELPSLPGSPHPTERLHTRDFGPHVAGAVERSIRGNPYKSGPQQSPAQTFNHYIAVARGSKLVDNVSINRMEALAQQFDLSTDRQGFFSREIRPFLLTLKPERRGHGTGSKPTGNPFPNSKMPNSH